jgi:excisionase family DNA binding protein
MSVGTILLSVREVAELTGFAEGTLRHWVGENRIPYVRLSSRCVRFRRCDIEAWLEQKLVKPADAGLFHRDSPTVRQAKHKV